MKSARICSFVIACASFVSIWNVVAEEVHLVKRGDTVFEIAQQYGVPSKIIAERNGLSSSYHIYPGQRLFIPNGDATPPSKGSGDLPYAVARAIERAPVRAGRWKHIVIHHSAVDTGTVQSMEQYHRNVRHMENGLAYHFVIGNGSGMKNGEVAVGHRWNAQLDGGHLASDALNHIAIGICLVGNFDEHLPTSAQMRSLRALCRKLMERCNLDRSDIKTHQQINTVGTRCPGERFPFKAFISSLESQRVPVKPNLKRVTRKN